MAAGLDALGDQDVDAIVERAGDGRRRADLERDARSRGMAASHALPARSAPGERDDGHLSREQSGELRIDVEREHEVRPEGPVAARADRLDLRGDDGRRRPGAREEPSPPACATAAISSGPAQPPIGAWRIGRSHSQELG